MTEPTSLDPETETARSHRQRLPPDLRPSILWVFPEHGKLTSPEGRHVIGRADSCQTVLSGAKISREHAEITPVGSAFAIRDLGSRNGVSVNGRLIDHPTALSEGDVLRLGEWVGVVVTGVDDGGGSFDEIAPGLLGGHKLRAALEPVRKIVERGLPLVIEGQTGTGKERVARALHAWSKRKGEYVGVNCAAIPHDLAEAELFGHAKGAFTGADRARPGYFRQANGGTLLLDEFLELPPKTQAKLLRVLEEWEVQPVGESRAEKISVLVLAATQAPLAQVVEAGQLRNDLVARLGVITLRLPPLEERREDIPPLFRFFVQEEAGAARMLDPELIEWLCLQRFKQNVRELEWLARAMVAMHDDVNVLGLEHLPAQYRQNAPSATTSSTQKASRIPPPLPSNAPNSVEAVPDDDDVLFQQLVRALDENNGVVLRAADALGITRQKAYRMLSKHPGFELDSLRKKR
jgi:transcriptional regulator with GAF, ATPase, and Fis domain